MHDEIRTCVMVAAATVGVFAGMAGAEVLRIGGGAGGGLEATYDTGTGRFTLLAGSPAKAFAVGSCLGDGDRHRSGPQHAASGPVPVSEAGPFSAKLVDVTDRTFGAGKCIRIARADGGREEILAFPGLPFVLFRTTVRNGGAAPAVVDRVATVSATIDLGKPAGELKALGTGGLATPASKPGSYMWLAVADPATRRGVVGGWLTTDRGSGVVFGGVAEDNGDRHGGEKGAAEPVPSSQPTLTEGKGDWLRIGTLFADSVPVPASLRPTLTAQVEYGRLRIAAGASETLETFALGYFDDARLGLEAWANAVAKVYAIKLPAQPVGYCTWYHAGASNEKALAAQSAFAAATLKPFGFSFVQIDDGWQEGDPKGNGPAKNFTAHRPKGPYPAGMKAAADDCRRLGLRPGIWFMPFAGTWNDPYFADKQDWFARAADGKPFDTAWGGTCLDMTHPAARQYVRSEVGRICHEWGYGYLKMDGLWTGSATRQQYVNDAYKDDHIGEAVLHDPNKTNVEAFRDGLKLVRAAAGADVLLLGCCAPQNMRSYGGAFGLLDAMRVGPDNGPDWDGLLRGPVYGSRNYHLNGRIWYNDPDPIYLRPSVPIEQVRVICSWVTLAGQLSVSSDEFAKLPPERLDILRRTMPSHGLPARPADLFDEPLPRVWVVTANGAVRRDVIGLFNWDRKIGGFDVPVERLGLAAGVRYAAFDFWAGAMVVPFRDRLTATLPPRSCQVLAVRPILDRPLLLSTSRHITQGIVDVAGETWDPAANELAGVGRVVAGDPYELRILTHSTRGVWKPVSAEAEKKGTGYFSEKVACPLLSATGGVWRTMVEEAGMVRATIVAKVGGEVSWRIRFDAPTAAGTAPPASNAAEAPPAVGDLKADVPELGDPVTLTWQGAGPFFEVRRDQAVLRPACGTRSCVDATPADGGAHRYAVVPVDFDGRRGSPAEVGVRTARPDPGPKPPAPQVSLTTLKPLSTRTGWGKFGVGKNVAGGPLRLGKETFTDGIGLHAEGEAVYARQPEWKRFVAVVGIDEAQRPQHQSSLVCELAAEDAGGKKATLAKSPTLRFDGVERWHFNVPLPDGCTKVHLLVHDAGDGDKSDHADWVSAGFRTD